jgi:peptidoglycan/LPS O-acetylase OafA/YrhL
MSKRHLGELDILRFGAALAVLFFHFAFRGASADGLSPLLYDPLDDIAKYGYLGVDLFFMISGFVIMLSAQSGSVLSFTIGRIARLYPAFWLCCSVTFAAVLLSDTVLFPDTLRVWFWNMTMRPGLFSAPYLDGSYWSLAVELKFYILVACIIAIGQVARMEYFIFGWLVAAVINNFLPMPWVANKLLLPFAPCFIAGAIFFFMFERGATPLRWAGIGVSGILLIKQEVAVCAEQAAHYNVPFSPLVVCCTLTAFFLFFAAIIHGRTGALGGTKWPLLGALTYPLYLIHQTIGYLLFNAFYDTLNVHLLFWGTVVLSLVFAYVVAVHFERHATPLFKKAMIAVCSKVSRLVSVRVRRS